MYTIKSFKINICLLCYILFTSIIGFFPTVLQIFNNCTCVGLAASKSGNSSGMVGRCQKDNGCAKMFLYFLVIAVITSYTLSVGGIPGYILLLRWTLNLPAPILIEDTPSPSTAVTSNSALWSHCDSLQHSQETCSTFMLFSL